MLYLVPNLARILGKMADLVEFGRHLRSFRYRTHSLQCRYYDHSLRLDQCNDRQLLNHLAVLLGKSSNTLFADHIFREDKMSVLAYMVLEHFAGL